MSPRRATAALAVVLVGVPVFNAHVLQPWVKHNTGTDRGVWWANNGLLLALHVVAFLLAGYAVSRPTPKQRNVGLGIVAGAIVVVVAHQTGILAESYADAFTPSTGLERVAYLANAIAVGGMQEPLWRGFAFEQLRSHWRVPVVAAVAIISLSFGYYHGGFFALPNSVFTGTAAVGLSWLYLRTESLWWPILLHVGFNVAAGAFS